MADNIAKVVMIDRSVYDNLNPPENNTIYFVREGSPYTSKALSLYVGEAKQCDLLDITGEATFDPQTNEYSIPQAYRIEGKLLFSQQTIVTEKLNPGDQKTDDNSYSFFRISMWDSTSGKFKDCTGFPNNVILVKDGQLPYTGSQGVPGDAIKDFIYVDVMNRSIYVFDGNSYIPIIDLSQYATKEWVQDYHDSHPTPVNIDNITILKSTIGGVPDVLHGAGADVSGKEVPFNSFHIGSYEIGTNTSGEYKKPKQEALSGATILNYYEQNKPALPNSVTIGKYNAEFYPNGYSASTYSGNNLLGGSQNWVEGANLSLLYGFRNKVSISGGEMYGATILGRMNTLTGSVYSGSSAYHCAGTSIIGALNTFTNNNTDDASLSASSIIGMGNNVTLNDRYTHIILGYSNTLTTSQSANCGDFIAGDSNVVTNTTGVNVIGYLNTFSGSNTGSSRGCAVVGCFNNVQGKPSESVIVIGKSNNINTSSSAIQGTNVTFARISCIGDGNSVNFDTGSTVQGADGVYSFGMNNGINVSGSGHGSRLCAGIDLRNNWDYCTVYGIGNVDTLPTGVTKPSVIVGSMFKDPDNQDALTRRNLFVVDNDNTQIQYGNIVNKDTDMRLVSDFVEYELSSSESTNHSVVMPTLPTNGNETILSYNNSNTVNITSIEISSLTVPAPYDSASPKAVGSVKDYCATIVFKPLSPISDVTALMPNFDPTSQNRIYLMNPTVDISTYTVIHLLLFYDGFNVCCTVAGYEEVPTV